MDRMIESDLPITAAVLRWSDSPGYRAMVRRPTITSILVLKVDHVGDFVMSFDALICLRKAFPDAAIDLCCGPWNQDLAQALGFFNTIYPIEFFNKRADEVQPSFDPVMVLALQGRRWDLAIDLRVDADTRVILRHVEATFKVGFDSPANNAVMTMVIPHYIPAAADANAGVHQTLLMLRLVRSTIDMLSPGDDAKQLLLGRVAAPADIDLSVARGRFLVACNTSSGRALKNWPLERFKRLIGWLANDLDVVVLLLGAKDQLQETAEILSFCGSLNVISAVGTTTLNQAVGLIAQSSLYIANDSGLTHIAARLDVPTIAIHSGVDPADAWAALGKHVCVLKAPVPCSPCHLLLVESCPHQRACVLNISEAAVQAAVRRQLFSATRYGDSSHPDQPALQDVRRSSSFLGWLESPPPDRPERYSDNYSRYHARGGLLNVDQMQHGFVAGNMTSNRGDMNRFYAFLLFFDQIVKEQLYGAIAELGVYKGNTASMLATFARRIGTTVYLLDTFEGFDDRDLHGRHAGQSAKFSDTSLEKVRQLVGTECVEYVQGYFPDTADQIPPDTRFCLVHIDCELYAPFKAALEFFYDRLVPGGFLVMHDYSSLHWRGTERAVDEFFADKPETVVPMPDGNGTAVIRKAAPADKFNNWFIQAGIAGFANAWVPANFTNAADFLASGWDEPEDWGVWGLGDSHTLRLVMAQAPDSDVELAVESCAVLLPARETQTVDVYAAGRHLARWAYSEDRNLAVRTLRIPGRAICNKSGSTAIQIEFRPASAEPPNELDPANSDLRPLGMGLVRFRQRVLS